MTSTRPPPPRIAEALRRAGAAAAWAPVVPAGGIVAGRPVPLDRLARNLAATVSEVSRLSRATAAAQLARFGCEPPFGLSAGDATPLAGLLLATPAGAWVLVCRDEPLPRRRFTIAHELGHLLLHFPADAPGPAAADAGAGGDGPATLFEADEGLSVCETCQGGSDAEPGRDPAAPALSLPWREREANQFAAELLMPEATVRALHEHYARRYGSSPRFLESHIAGDLLVSRQAVRYRLADLELAEGA